MSTTHMTYKERLQLRITELTERHDQLVKAKTDWEKDAPHTVDASISEGTVKDHVFNHANALVLSTMAAAIWDTKKEVEMCLSLYEMSLTSISHKRTLDEATAFVYSCIWSCKTTDQVNACESMIANLGIIYEKHPQIKVAVYAHTQPP